MYRQDYVLRLIEQFARALIGLRNRILRREQQSGDIGTEIGEIARASGLDLDIARKLDPAMLLLWLAPTGEVNEPKIWLMAELLYLAGRERAEAGTGGEADLRRALKLFSHLPAGWRPSDDLASAGERVAELEQLLAPGSNGPT